MVGDRSSGVFNLRIINASLDDDAEFDCQVGPMLPHKPIRHSARLTVIGKTLLSRSSAASDRKEAPSESSLRIILQAALTPASSCL